MASNTFYLNNPNLKRANVKIPFTQAQHNEYIKCSLDVEYFITTYMRIVNVDQGLIPFAMYDYQKKMVNTFADNRFVITKMPRQTGKSTTVTGYMLWKILFQDNQSCVILANKGRLANELLEKIKLAYEYLPMWMQQGVVTWNKGNIALENGSKVLASATSSSAVRGGSYNFILLDEFAHVQRNLAEAFFASTYPTISSGKKTQVIIVSTPLGMNHYYKMWTDAIEGRSEYVPIDVHWRECPVYDDAWKEQTIANTSEEQFRQEFECEFIGSTNTLLSAKKLRELTWVKPRKDNWDVDVYLDPEPGHTYVMTVDTAHGVGLDYSAFCVFDVTKFPYRIAAKYRSNTASPMFFPEIISRTGMLYNEAYVLAETNDIGMAMVEALQRDLEYTNILSTVSKGRIGQKLGQGFGQRSMFGVKMTKQVKSIGCSNIKDIIEDDKLIVEDYEIIQELFTFVSKKLSYEAEEGHHDDLVMTLVLFGWLVRQPMFQELSSTDIRNRLAQERYAEMWDEVPSPGYIDAGEESVESLEHGRIEDGFLDPFRL